MHELSVVQSLVTMANEHAIRSGAVSVKYVTLEIGKMTGVIPHYISMYYPEVCEGTLLEGSELRIEETEALAFCRNCGNTYVLEGSKDVCPSCSSDNYEVIEGDKLILKELAFE